MKFFQLAALQLSLSLWPSSVSAQDESSQIEQELGPRLSSDASITFPGSTEFEIAGSRWTQGVVNPQYFASVEVQTERDVELAIKYANQQGVPFLATTGGHGFWKGLNRVQNGIQIYMRGINNISLDQKTGLATMGGGILAHEVQQFLSDNGKYAATGLCPCVSVMGPGLGGGHGILQGRFGLVADNIVSARVTLGNGTSITVSEKSHSDLYWGLKGAGQNFGIVTSFKYRVFDEPKRQTYTIHTHFFKEDKLEEIFTEVNKLNERKNRPVELLIWGTIRRNNALDANNPVIELIVKYDGTVKQSERYNEIFLDLGPLTTSTKTFKKYINLGPALGFPLDGVACDHSYDNGFMSISLVRHNMTALRQAFDVYAEATTHPGLASSYVLLESYPINEVRNVPVRSTAVSAEERKANVLVGGNFIFTRGDVEMGKLADESQKTLKDIFRAGVDVKKDGLAGTYVNYANGEQDAHELYGYEPWRVDRLNKLSAKYDPRKRFGFFAGFRSDNAPAGRRV